MREIVPAWDFAPRAGPRHVLRREYFGSLLYDKETMQYVPYDVEATEFLLRGPLPGPPPLRGGGSAGEGAFRESLIAEGVLDANGALDARVVADRSAPDRLSAPLTVYLGATQGCNLACGHCSTGSGPGALGALDAALMERLFHELHDLGCMQVHVSGGEPLLRPDLLPALEPAFALGLNVLITTNGTLVTDEVAEELAKRPFRTLSVSLDGPAAANDLVRGAGSFAPALEGLKRLAKLRPVGVTTTFTPALVGKIEELVALVIESGAASLSLRPALPSGRALAQPWLVAAQKDFLDATKELDRLQETSPIPLFHPPEVPHEKTSAFVLERFGCVAGNLVCSVTPAGQVNPCALLGPRFDAGSLRDHTLHELWTNGRPFTRLRLLEGNGDCWTCRHYDHCGGGCRARALVATGDLDAKDPWCKWEPRPDGAGLVLP